MNTAVLQDHRIHYHQLLRTWIVNQSFLWHIFFFFQLLILPFQLVPFVLPQADA
ncbi:uncharacterized protein METZ01_LOCUS104134 [marine metagenome]|uniref:Uncharacterized protein n=1 Tax=marine metagenome TaxID=408172 RepID=A0A381WFH5_9ZZZZ